MLNYFLKQEIKEHSIQNIDEEICGLLVNTPTGTKVFRSENLAPNKKSNFVVSPFDYLRASEFGQIIGCYHSHINDNSFFSEYDKKNADKHKIIYVLYSIKYDEFKIYLPNEQKNPLLNRKFEIGKYDCYSLVQDYFLLNFNIKLREYDRKHGWFKKNPELIYENFINEGFEKIICDEFEKHDVLCMGIDDKKLFHFMIYQGNNTILHHPSKKLSTIETLSQFRKNKIKCVLRHKSIKNI